METLLQLIEVYGLWVVFVCVLLDQGGLPFPAYPPMIVTAAVAVDAGNPVLPVLAVATLAALLADLLWYAAGQRFGTSLLRLMCRLSLSPDSCVGLTRRIYARWGAPSLIVSKFVPGFAAVATTLAGESKTRLSRFVLYDTLGAALWTGTAVALGVIFHAAVGALLLRLEDLGHYAIVLLITAIAAFVALKWWQRYRFRMQIRMSRIPIPDLTRMIRKSAGAAVPATVNSAHRSPRGSASATIPPEGVSTPDPESDGGRDGAGFAHADTEVSTQVQYRDDGNRDAESASPGKSAPEPPQR